MGGLRGFFLILVISAGSLNPVNTSAKSSTFNSIVKKSCALNLVALVLCSGPSGCIIANSYDFVFQAQIHQIDTDGKFAEVGGLDLIAPTKVVDLAAMNLTYDRVVNVDEKNAIRQAIQNAVVKYPDGFLPSNIKKVYFLEQLHDNKLPAGGICLLSNICISVETANSTFIQKTFHHELNHYLVARHPFNWALWKSANPSSFKYTNSAEWYLLHNGGSGPTAELYEQGFATQYGQSDLREDAATMTESLFDGGPDFWRAVDRYPRLRMKVSVLIDFYHSLDSHFSEEYFRKLQNETN